MWFFGQYYCQLVDRPDKSQTLLSQIYTIFITNLFLVYGFVVIILSFWMAEELLGSHSTKTHPQPLSRGEQRP